MELADDPIDINIGLNHQDAGYAAARYLYDLGHRRIGHLTARGDPRSLRRHAGYRRALEEVGLNLPGLVASTPLLSTVRIGTELFLEVLEQTPDLDAIFCCNDDLALGVLFECHRHGIRVPEDISIVGFNDLEYCASTFPALTSVTTPRAQMARRAAETVLEIIRGSGERPSERRIDLGFRITERASTQRRTPCRTVSAAAV